MSIDFFSAFVIGVLGSGHCLGMCGGITSMLTSAISNNTSHSKTQLIFGYNVGRILSYTLIGGIVGFSGSIAAKQIGVPLAGLRMVAALFLVFLGLYIGQWLMWLNRVEKLGKRLWKYLSPYSKNFIPVNSPKKAIALGALWGWLPCGLIYSMLTWSLASGTALNGALIMTFFGLGTLPALLVMSYGAIKTKAIISNLVFRKLMALSLIIYGLYSLYIAYHLLF
jgi:sulfite exporter TauE/SafE